MGAVALITMVIATTMRVAKLVRAEAGAAVMLAGVGAVAVPVVGVAVEVEEHPALHSMVITVQARIHLIASCIPKAVTEEAEGTETEGMAAMGIPTVATETVGVAVEAAEVEAVGVMFTYRQDCFRAVVRFMRMEGTVEAAEPVARTMTVMMTRKELAEVLVEAEVGE